ncbi:MAG: sodium:proline symporter, partial [Pseudobutyrivibrio sp.]|nr:sodium:proline symporter [Pseudobutyrivibrio sp.]
GMIGGAATVFIWKFAVRPLGGAFDIYELLPAIIVSVICVIVVSLITPAPDKSIVEEFEASRN